MTQSAQVALLCRSLAQAESLQCHINQFNVDVVIGNTRDATEIVEMMNKNVAAYLINYLVDSGLPLALVKR